MVLSTILVKSAAPSVSRPFALLVEDSIVNQKLLSHMLDKEGFEVVLAVNGLEAVDAFKQQSFDLVIMDIQMPVMDGLEATRRIRKYESAVGCHVPIVAVTAGIGRGPCMSAGVDSWVEKPVSMPVFHDVLSQVCQFDS